MPKGHINKEDNPSYVITAKMNPDVSPTERLAWDIWQGIDRREVIRRGFTSKAELVATALIQYYDQNPPEPKSNVEAFLKQILAKLNSGGYTVAPELTEDESDVLMDFAKNRQMLDDMIQGE